MCEMPNNVHIHNTSSLSLLLLIYTLLPARIFCCPSLGIVLVCSFLSNYLIIMQYKLSILLPRLNNFILPLIILYLVLIAYIYLYHT